MTATTTTKTLSKPETTRLAELEKTIERGLETFLEVGQALMEIRDSKLYRETDRRFGDYCRKRWGFTARRANQLVQAAKVGTVVPVENERQARELAVISPGDAQVIREVWDRATELASENRNKSDKVTAATIREAGKLRMREVSQSEKAFRMQLSPRGKWGPSGPTVPVNIPASLAAAEQAKATSDAIRLVLGPWTADGKLPERRRVPESNTVRAWREKLNGNGNGSAPRDLRKIIADIEKLLASLPADSPDHAALAKALEVLDEVA